MQKLRKRRVVVIGHGLSVISFCKAFRSKFAEITVLTEEPNFAPDAVLNSVASCRLQSEKFSRSIRIMFSKRKDIKILTSGIQSIDTELRRINLKDTDEFVEYDFLLIGKSRIKKAENIHTISSFSDALELSKASEAFSSQKNMAFIGSGSKVLECAVSHSKNCNKVFVIHPEETTFKETTKNTLTRINYLIRQTGVHIFQKSKVSHRDADKIQVEDQTMECNLLVDCEPDLIPEAVKKLGLETIQHRLLKTRPDSSIPGNDRFYVFSELRTGKDGMGKDIPNQDIADIQHSTHLAKIIRGRIEMWKHYDIDTPSFVFRPKGDFCRLQNGLSTGVFGKFFFKGIKATFLDTVFHRYPVFALTYGRFDGLIKLFQWSIANR